MQRTFAIAVCLIICLVTVPRIVRAADASADAPRKKLRVGIIGLDTSHVAAFTNVINSKTDPAKDGDLAYITVVAAYPAGSPDVASSRDRVEGFTKQLRDKGVEIVDSIPALLDKVDVILLESVDGRPHLQQAIPVIKAGKPLFIDKPVAGSLVDAIAIFELAKKHNVPMFTSSSLRFSPGILEFRAKEGDAKWEHPVVGRVTGCDAWGPCSLEEHHPDLYWYGVHGCEILYTIMGSGCQQVTRVQTDSTEHVTGVWEGGRVGTFRGLRSPNKQDYSAFVFGTKGMTQAGKYGGYEPLVREIATFFQTHVSPVPAEESIELFAFMEAADESKRQGGAPVKIADVIAKARAEAMKKVAAVD